MLIRASGPALAAFGVTGTLPDPSFSSFGYDRSREQQRLGRQCADCGDGAASVGAFGWSSGASKDSAILVTLPPGPYTAQVSGASGDTGIALVEVYEVP